MTASAELRDQWEYHAAPMPSQATPIDIAALLNQIGRNGWELCAIDYGCFLFKRPRTEVSI